MSAAAAPAAAAAAAGAPAPAPGTGATGSCPQQQQLPQPRMVDCAVSLHFLTEFCKGVPEDMPTWKVVTDVVVPATRERKCRYVETLDPRDVGRCDYFISHRWATPFKHLVDYTRKHLVQMGDCYDPEDAAKQQQQQQQGREASKAGGGGGGAKPGRCTREVFVWCDIFAINQHPGQVQADDLSQLKDCVVTSQQTLLCLDDKGLVLTRIWCLYEIWNTVLAGGPLKLAVLGYDVEPEAFKDVYIQLDVAEAQATVEEDRARILADIAASTGLTQLNLTLKQALVGSTQAEAENAEKVFLPTARTYKDYERVRLALTKHQQMLMGVGRYQEVQRYTHLLQSVSEQSTKVALLLGGSSSQSAQGGRRGSSSGGRLSSGGGGAAAASAAALPPAPEHEWRHYPQGAGLRARLGRGKQLADAAKFNEAMEVYREVAAKPGPGVSPADAAACRLTLAAFLRDRGYADQAKEEAHAALPDLERALGEGSLALASARCFLACLMEMDHDTRERQLQLLDSAYALQRERLGRYHAATLATLKQKAEMVYRTTCDSTLKHQYCVDVSGGRDLLAAPAAAPQAAQGARGKPPQPPKQQQQQQPPKQQQQQQRDEAALLPLSDEAVQAWQGLAMAIMMDRGEEALRVFRALCGPQRRRNLLLLRRYATMPAAGSSGGDNAGSSEEAREAAAQLRRMVLAAWRAAGTPLPAGLDPEGFDVAAVDLEALPGLAEFDNPSLDCGMMLGEMHSAATVLAKRGDLEAALRLEQRCAATMRATPKSDIEIALPTGKVRISAAYEEGVYLDMVVPGFAKFVKERKNKGKAAAAGLGDASQQGEAEAGMVPYDGPSYVALYAQATPLMQEARWGDVLPLLAQAVRAQAGAHGPVSKEVVDARLYLANILRVAGKEAEAVAEVRGALAVHEKLRGGKDPEMARTLQQLADMVDRTEAEALHKRALELVTKVYGPTHMQVGLVMLLYGSFVMGDVARLQEGLELHKRGQQIQEEFQKLQANNLRAY